MELRGAIALVTGGGHRLGRQIVLALAQVGCNVVINYHRSRLAAEATAQAARSYGVRALPLCADAADAEQVDRLLARVLEEFAGLDVFVANAGAFRRTPFATVTEADWDDMMRGNFRTFAVPAHRIGRLMRERKSGCIVALADVAGLRPWADYVPYSTAKGCVIACTQALAVELAPYVRANAIAPGPILFPDDFDAAARKREIDRTLLGRQGDPAHISDAVLFLARNDYVTGTVLPIDGGRLLT